MAANEAAAALGAALVAVLADEDLNVLADRLAPLVAARLQSDEGDDGYVGTDGAAAFMGCPRGRIHDLVQVGQLKPLRDGRSLRFRKRDLVAYLEASG
jgi:excisionase family DNA binding protein